MTARGDAPVAVAPTSSTSAASSEPPDLWDRCAAWLQRSGALPALGLLTLVLIAMYAHMFDGELVGDDLSFHMAESARIADCLRAGDFDLWNPSGNAGFASAYYYQVVPQLVSAIPTAVFGHHLFFFQLSVFLPLVLMPAAAYRAMRLFGATPWQAFLAALAVSFVNGESRWGTGNAGTFVVGLYTQTWAFAAFPLALAHAARWVTQSKSLAPALAWGSFVAFCHPFAGIALAVALVAGVLGQLVLRASDALLAEIGQGMVRDPSTGLIPAAMAALGERWRNPPPRPWAGELARLAILGAGFAIAWLPIWLPLFVDYAGFGGFPHRVGDESGPGLATLLGWYASGSLLDHGRPSVLSWSLPIAILLARAPFLRWLWAPAVAYAALLALGPHMPKIGDDLIPPVRFLGPLQVVIALALGAAALVIGQRLWNAVEGSPMARAGRLVVLAGAVGGACGLTYLVWKLPDGSAPLVVGYRITFGLLSQAVVRWLLLAVLLGCAVLAAWLLWDALGTQYGLRTGVAAIAAALGVLLTVSSGPALLSRVHVLDDYAGSHPAELRTINWVLQYFPPGRKQVGKGAENHWWNLLSYEYGRRPALLMMGGGGLQASPSYDFLWTVRDFTKLAWVYDAPLLVFDRANTDKMPAGDLVFATTNHIVRRLPAPGLVSAVEVTGTLPAGRAAAHEAAIAWLKTDQPLSDRVLAYAGSGGPSGAPPHGSVLRASRQDSPGDAPDIVADVDVTERTTFMARESWHPRWRAYIDGAPAPIRRVTPDFPAVDVPPGHHVVGFRFARPWWMHASWLAWPLVPLAAWWVLRRRSRRAPRPAPAMQ
ncbi:MAG TPA: hypothetical protein VLM79_01960 [Kofleriaceae bacterium]|nr:hypothetical protein [Kofleriaceae bacterium]